MGHDNARICSLERCQKRGNDEKSTPQTRKIRGGWVGGLRGRTSAQNHLMQLIIRCETCLCTPYQLGNGIESNTNC
jgi:hypothetical protein